MTRKMMRAKIHRATVTQADVDYEGSISIDRTLMDAIDLLPNEAVHITSSREPCWGSLSQVSVGHSR